MRDDITRMYVHMVDRILSLPIISRWIYRTLNNDYYDTAKRGTGIIAHAHAHGGDGWNATTITQHAGANESSDEESDDDYDNDDDYIDCDVTSSSDSSIEPRPKKRRAKTSTPKRRANKVATEPNKCAGETGPTLINGRACVVTCVASDGSSCSSLNSLLY